MAEAEVSAATIAPMSTEFFTAQTKLPAFLPYPKFLLQTELTLIARQLYAVLLGRSTLSRQNGWTDEAGSVYVIYPITELANTVDRSPATVKNALHELEVAGLILRKRDGMNRPNHIFVRVPTDSFSAPRGSESCPSNGWFSGSQTDRKLAANKMKEKNKKNKITERKYYEEGESL